MSKKRKPKAPRDPLWPVAVEFSGTVYILTRAATQEAALKKCRERRPLIYHAAQEHACPPMELAVHNVRPFELPKRKKEPKGKKATDCHARPKAS